MTKPITAAANACGSSMWPMCPLCSSTTISDPAIAACLQLVGERRRAHEVAAADDDQRRHAQVRQLGTGVERPVVGVQRPGGDRRREPRAIRDGVGVEVGEVER